MRQSNNILTERGVMDIFIACHDNLKGLEEAIHAVYPKTKQQLCIVHQIRNSTKFVQYKDRKEICADLKKIYGAVNLDDAVPRPLRFMRFWLTDERKNGRPFFIYRPSYKPQQA